MNKTILKYGGIVAIALGATSLFLSGTGEAQAMEILSAVFVLLGIIANIIGDKLK